jgi:hypothetical protein
MDAPLPPLTLNATMQLINICPWNELACIQSAGNGRLEVLQCCSGCVIRILYVLGINIHVVYMWYTCATWSMEIYMTVYMYNTIYDMILCISVEYQLIAN